MNQQKKSLELEWIKSQNKLKLELIMPDFESAVYLVNKIAEKAEKIKHHPDLRIYKYNHIAIEIYSHGESKITEKDYELAKEIEEIFKKEE